MNCVEERIIDIYSRINNVDKSSLHGQVLLRDTGINSMSIVQIMVEIENEFDIEIDDADLDFSRIETLGKIFDIVKKKL